MTMKSVLYTAVTLSERKTPNDAPTSECRILFIEYIVSHTRMNLQKMYRYFNSIVVAIIFSNATMTLSNIDVVLSET